VQVRTSLAPWEKKIGEAAGRITVAASERDALARRALEARKRLDGAVKALAAATAGAAAREKHIAELEAAATQCRWACNAFGVGWGGVACSTFSAAV
jgi:hypothetical protein